MASRSLTSGEKSLAKTIYKSSINYSKVKIHDDSYIFFQPDNSGMTPRGEIYMSGTAYKADYSKEKNHMKGFFIHEMAHVWQWQNSVLDPIASAIGELICNFGFYSKAYKYTLDDSKDLLDYGMEQQAMILEDYYYALSAAGTSGASPKGGKPRTKMQAVLSKFITNPSYPKAIALQRTQEALERLKNKMYCFPADTEVLQPSGLRPISAIRPGDAVLTFDPSSNGVRSTRVSRVDRHRGCFPLHRAELAGTSLLATSGHRIADASRCAWTSVEQLADDACLGTDSGERRLLHVHHKAETCGTVYNLHLTDADSYFVTSAGVMVRDW